MSVFEGFTYPRHLLGVPPFLGFANISTKSGGVYPEYGDTTVTAAAGHLDHVRSVSFSVFLSY